MLNISTRLDETELLASVRAAEQINDLREELEAAVEDTRTEHEEEVALLEARLAGLPTVDDVADATTRVDRRLAVVSTAEDLAALARRVDHRIDDLRERTEEVHVLAEKAKDRADFASDSVLEAQSDLQDDLDELRRRQVEESLNEAGADDPDSDVLLSLETFRADLQAMVSGQTSRQNDRIHELEAALSRQAERLAALDTEGVASGKRLRWQSWLQTPVRMPESPIGALPPGDSDTE